MLLYMLFSFRVPFFVCFPFSVQYLLYTPISSLFTPNSLTTIFLVWYRVCGARIGGEGGGGGSMGGVEVFLASSPKLC